MRAFIVMWFVAVACADKLGYNYQPVGHSDNGLSFQPGNGNGGSGGNLGGIGSGSSLGGGSLGGLGSGNLGGLGSGNLGGLGSGNLGGLGSGNLGGLGSGNLGGLGSGNLGGIGGGNSADLSGQYDAPESIAPTAEFEKEFFTFTAPENEFDDPLAGQKVASALHKGLRVVFIKGPENKGLENAALALAKQAADQQTAIYVLNKQTDIGDLANKLNALRNNKNNKPDVHFVKYRTPEDAANAQRAIQSQYDQLGGTSAAHNGGVAPVLNFASQGPAHKAAAKSPENSYLPASVFRLRV